MSHLRLQRPKLMDPWNVCTYVLRKSRRTNALWCSAALSPFRPSSETRHGHEMVMEMEMKTKKNTKLKLKKLEQEQDAQAAAQTILHACMLRPTTLPLETEEGTMGRFASAAKPTTTHYTLCAATLLIGQERLHAICANCRRTCRPAGEKKADLGATIQSSKERQV